MAPWDTLKRSSSPPTIRLGCPFYSPRWKLLLHPPFFLLMQQFPCQARGSLTLGRVHLPQAAFPRTCVLYLGLVSPFPWPFGHFQYFFLSVSLSIMSSKLGSDVPQMAFWVSYLCICRRMPRFLTLNKAIFHLLLWVLGERTGVLFVQIQQYRNMHQCWAWTFVCLFLCLPSLLLQIRDSLCNKNELLHSIPKILDWKKKKKEGDCTSSKLFPFSTFPCLQCDAFWQKFSANQHLRLRWGE